jgi:mono/diheme cytochrome c family protein
LRRGLIIGCIALLVAQIVPYGRNHTNPPVSAEPKWDRPVTRELFYRACADCHSNATRWPWYSHIAPVSWLVQHDVDDARVHFNVSEWDRPDQHGDEAAQLVRQDDMPPYVYRPAHPDARLSDAERESLIRGLVATFGDEGGDGHADERDHEHVHEH